MPPWEKYQSAPSESATPWVKYGSAPSSAVDTEPMTEREKFESSVLGRALRGFEGPAITLLKMVGPDSMKKQLGEIDALKESGMRKRGNEGFDWAGLVGSLAPGLAIGGGVTAALPAGMSAIGKGVVSGAVSSMAQPVPGEDELSSAKVFQGLTGAAAGGAVPAVIQGAQMLGGLAKRAVEPLYESGREAILSRFQRSRLPEGSIDKVVQALSNPKIFVQRSNPMSGEAMAHLPESAMLAAHQKAIAKLDPAPFAAHEQAQQAARKELMTSTAGSADDLAAAIAARKAATDQMRDAALTRANEAGQKVPILERMASRSEKEAVKGERTLQKLSPQVIDDPDALKTAVQLHGGVAPKMTDPLLTQRETVLKKLLPDQIAAKMSESDAAKQALQGLEDAGLRPLMTKGILKNIQSAASSPEIRASEITTKTLDHLKTKLESLTKSNGTIDAFDLYMVRKELGKNIGKFAKDAGNFDKRFASKVLIPMQASIDSAIEGAGGTGWREYLETFARHSKGIDRMEELQSVGSKLTGPLGIGERPGAFANAVANADSAVLKPSDTEALQSIVNDLSRREAFNKLASKGAVQSGEAIPGNIVPRLPNLLSRPAMIANAVMKYIGESGEEKIAKLASEQYRDPALLAKSLSRQDQQKYRAILDALMTHQGGVTGSVVGRNQ